MRDALGKEKGQTLQSLVIGNDQGLDGLAIPLLLKVETDSRVPSLRQGEPGHPLHLK